MSETVRRMKANKKVEGKPCGWSGQTIRLGDDVAICEACGTEHLAGHWNTEGGCSRRGCANAPLKRLDEPVSPMGQPIPMGKMQCPHCTQLIPSEAQLCPFCDMVTTPDGVYRGPKTTAPGASASLVWGIVGLFICGIILGFVAINKSKEAKALIAADPRYEGEGLATAGMVLGILDIIGWAFALFLNLGG